MKLPSLKNHLSVQWHRPLWPICLAAMFGFFFPLAALVRAQNASAIVLGQTPPAVQKTVLANIGNGQVTSISKGDEHGVTTYEVNFMKGTQPRDLHVGEDGTLLSIWIAFNEAPPAVQKSIQAQVGADKLGDIEKTFEAEEISYVVDITTKDGRESQFSIDESGILLETEIPLSEAPAAVQKTIADQMGNGTLTTLSKIIDDKVTYDAEFTKDGKTGNVTVAGDGALLSVEITLAETGPAQKTILEKVGDGKIISIKKSFEKRDRVLPFMVESVKDGKAFNFSVGPKGRFLGMDD